MASSSGTSSGGSGSTAMIPNSGSEGDLQAVMDQRKRKRMISNRESARRSRMRKQKHLDDLAAQAAHLRNQNHQILTSVTLTTQRYMAVEAENSVLRAQLGELNHRLESLNEIIHFLNGTTNGVFDFEQPVAADSTTYFNPLNMPYQSSQPAHHGFGSRLNELLI